MQYRSSPVLNAIRANSEVKRADHGNKSTMFNCFLDADARVGLGLAMPLCGYDVTFSLCTTCLIPKLDRRGSGNKTSMMGVVLFYTGLVLALLHTSNFECEVQAI